MTLFGFNTTATERQPFASTQKVSASSTGTQDKVAHALAAIISGDYSTATGTNPTYAWGLNMFTTTGAAPGDANGADIMNLVETSIQAPTGTTIGSAKGLVAEAGFFGAGVGAAVTQMESMRVAAPKRKDGATAGTAKYAYGLYVEAVDPSTLDSTLAYSVFVAGGASRFCGRVDVTDNVSNSGTGTLSIFAGYTDADGARLQLLKAASGGHLRARLTTPGAEVQVHDGVATTFSVSRTGLPKWNAAANQQATVGAAGKAAPLPSAPTKYLRVVDSTGATLVIPAYAAS